MLIPCEIAVRYALPYIRRRIADELMNTHHLTQTETAKYLELDQSAVSLYSKRMRGNLIDLENDRAIQSLIAKQANVILQNDPVFVGKQKLFCEVCTEIRSKGYLCMIHKESDAKIDKACTFCKTNVCKGFDYYLKREARLLESNSSHIP